MSASLVGAWIARPFRVLRVRSRRKFIARWKAACVLIGDPIIGQRDAELERFIYGNNIAYTD